MRKYIHGTMYKNHFSLFNKTLTPFSNNNSHSTEFHFLIKPSILNINFYLSLTIPLSLLLWNFKIKRTVIVSLREKIIIFNLLLFSRRSSKDLSLDLMSIGYNIIYSNVHLCLINHFVNGGLFVARSCDNIFVISWNVTAKDWRRFLWLKRKKNKH